jgi:hypothetical protein
VGDSLETQLFYHFIAETSTTMPFGDTIWHTEVPSLAFNYKFLMHGVLLLSAMHLSYLNPTDRKYKSAVFHHLSHALPLYREELAKGIHGVNADALMATGVLLYHYAWASVDHYILGPQSTQRESSSSPLELQRGHREGAFNFAADPIWTMVSGLREIFLGAIDHLDDDQSIFSETVAIHPRFAIRRAARRCAKDQTHFESMFSDHYHKYLDEAAYQVIDLGITELENDTNNLPHMAIYNAAGFSETSFHTTPVSAEQNSHITTQDQTPPPTLLDVTGTSEHSSYIAYVETVHRLAPMLSISSELEQYQQSSSHPGPDLSSRALPSIILSETSKHPQPSHGLPFPFITPDHKLVPSQLPSWSNMARYTMSFPIQCVPSFSKLTQQRDPRALFVLYHLYRSIRTNVPKKYWWCQRRGEVLTDQIRDELMGTPFEIPVVKSADEVTATTQSPVATSFSNSADGYTKYITMAEAAALQFRREQSEMSSCGKLGSMDEEESEQADMMRRERVEKDMRAAHAVRTVWRQRWVDYIMAMNKQRLGVLRAHGEV